MQQNQKSLLRKGLRWNQYVWTKALLYNQFFAVQSFALKPKLMSVERSFFQIKMSEQKFCFKTKMLVEKSCFKTKISEEKNFFKTKISEWKSCLETKIFIKKPSFYQQCLWEGLYFNPKCLNRRQSLALNPFETKIFVKKPFFLSKVSVGRSLF